MIDVGLLLSVVAVVGGVALARQAWPAATITRDAVADRMMAPAIAGVAVGRVAFMLIDDPRGLWRPLDLLLLRGGVEFWPGAAAAVAVAARQARRDGVPVGERLGDLLPLALIGYAAYETTCIVRDGCFGPFSRVGLRPPQSAVTQFPVGWAVAAALLLLALVVRRAGSVRPWSAVACAAVGVAAFRMTASLWLPSIHPGLDRLMITNAVFFTFGAILGAATVRSSTGTTTPGPAG